MLPQINSSPQKLPYYTYTVSPPHNEPPETPLANNLLKEKHKFVYNVNIFSLRQANKNSLHSNIHSKIHKNNKQQQQQHAVNKWSLNNDINTVITCK